MDSTKDLSILIRTRTAASGCIAKPPPGFSRWRELGHRCISRHSLPEDAKYGSQVQKLDQSRDPDPPRSLHDVVRLVQRPAGSAPDRRLKVHEKRPTNLC